MRRRVTGAACALALLGAPSVLPTAPALASGYGGSGAGTPAWLTYTRPAQFSTVSEEIAVPLRDGSTMRCTKISPAEGVAPVPGKHPVVLTNFFAYRALQQSAFKPMSDGLAERGYVTLSCSPRGSGGTAGDWAPFQSLEARDNYDVIEWAAVQPWSTGRIGQTGVSYGGISTYKAVSTNPPHLKAAVPVVAYNEVYREMVYPGGIRGTTLRWWPAVTWATSTADQTPDVALSSFPHYASFEAKAQEHPLFDSYWETLAVDIKAVDRSNIPILAIGGWNDLFPQGMVRNYQGAKDQTTLLMLPGAHGEFAPGVPQFNAGLSAMLSWFDRHLMQLPGTPMPGAKVTSWELPRLRGSWVEMADFPTQSVPIPLGERKSQTSSSFLVNPYDNGCSCVEHGLYNSTDYPINDQRVYDQGRVRFDQAPVDQDVLIVGSPVAKLRAALSTPKGNLVVRLQDVAPDGTSTVITTGWLNAQHRRGYDSFASIKPGQPYDFTVELWPTHWRLRAGHFLRITVSSGDIQHIEPTAPLGSTVTVFGGRDGSMVAVPFQKVDSR